MKFGRSGKGRSPKTLESLIELPYVLRVNVYVPSFSMILISSQLGVPRPSYPFWCNLGDQVKGRSPKKLNSLIEVPYVLYVKIHVLSYNMILISSPKRVPRLSYPFRGK